MRASCDLSGLCVPRATSARQHMKRQDNYNAPACLFVIPTAQLQGKVRTLDTPGPCSPRERACQSHPPGTNPQSTAPAKCEPEPTIGPPSVIREKGHGKPTRYKASSGGHEDHKKTRDTVDDCTLFHFTLPNSNPYHAVHFNNNASQNIQGRNVHAAPE